LNSIAFVKGIAICFILLKNTINYWLVYNFDLRYLYGYFFISLEVLGGSLLIFIFSFSIIFDLKKKMGVIPEKSNRNKVLKNGFIFILFGIVYNLISIPTSNFLINLWRWNILIFIGAAQIISYYSFKLVRWTRLAIGVSIIFLTAGLTKILFLTKDLNPFFNILYQLFSSPLFNYPILPYVSICFFSSVFGEIIYEAKILELKEALLRGVSSIIKYSVLLISVGLILPLIQLSPFITAENFNPEEYPFLEGISILNNYSFLYIPGMPRFLLMGTPANIFFVVGVALLILGISSYIIDIKMIDNFIINTFRFYGEFSITLLNIQFIFLMLLYQKIFFIVYIPISIGYIIILGFVMYSWQKYGKTILTVEWIIRKLSRINNDE